MSDSPTSQTDATDAQTELATTIQDSQDLIEAIEAEVPAQTLADLETVEDDLEGLEDDIEHADEALPEGFEADVQATQNDINDLQETLATSGTDPDLIREVEDVEDTVEIIEDRAVDARDQYGVKVDSDPVEFFDEATPTAEDILARFGKSTDDALVEEGTENTYSGDDEVDLSDPGVERFTSEPRTPGNA